MYLSLFLAAKFAVTIPWLGSSSQHQRHQQYQQGRHQQRSRKDSDKVSPQLADMPPPPLATTPDRRTAAAPPLYLLTLVFAPVGAAIYIASSRYTDFKHAGFDVLFSSIGGVACAWFGFRWYHLPIRRGAGWSWGPRCRRGAFGIGVGVASYVAGRDADPGLDLEHGAGPDATDTADTAAEPPTEMADLR